MDLHMPEFGNPELPFIERKNYRKLCYLLGIMLNANGERFVDEGENFRNYTYAQFGREILNQPQGFAWQIHSIPVSLMGVVRRACRSTRRIGPMRYMSHRFEHSRSAAE
jgi:hypothetical protein